MKWRAMRDRRTGRRRRWTVVAAIGLALPLAGWLLSSWALRWVPLPEGLLHPPPPALELADRQGRPLRRVPSPAGYVGDRLGLASISDHLVEATLAAEDRRFWRHGGVDWRATARAAFQWARYRRVISGGSTVSQQVIKLAQPRPRTLWTKAREAVQAWRLEQVWTKERILVEYLNRLDYGHRRIGCHAAAAFYFGKPVGDLSLAEAALLAGLPQAPARLDPHRHFDRARKRQEWILGRMCVNGQIPAASWQRALLEPIRLAPPVSEFRAPHFADLVLRRPDAALATDGPGPVQTTLDIDLNEAVERMVRDQVLRLREHRVRNGAAVVIENASGSVRALVGSEDYFEPKAGQVNGAWAPRSAGSAFKPFTYAMAFERDLHPATIVGDLPIEYPAATGAFVPENYDRRFHGPLRMRLALANSFNVPAVKVLDAIGGPSVLHRCLSMCGLTTLARPAGDYGLGLTIGNAEARLLELANAYACLARLGVYRPCRLVQSRPDRPATADGPADGARMISRAAAYLVADILSDPQARTLAFGVDSSLRFDFPVACKTGTSSGFRDNWAVGYTPEFTVGVWVGNFDGSAMNGVSGVDGAAPILHEVFDHLHERYGTTWYARPAEIVTARIHPLTGRRIPEGRPEGITEIFRADCLPAAEDATGCDQEGRVRLPIDYRVWFESEPHGWHERAVIDPALAAERLGGWTTEMPAATETAPASAGSPVRILSPAPGMVFYLDPDLPERGGRLRLKAAGPPGLEWHSGTLVFRREHDRDYALLIPGRHEIILRDPQRGGEARTWIEVRSL